MNRNVVYKLKSMQAKKMKVKFDVILLQNILIRDQAELLEPIGNINSKSKILFRCKCKQVQSKTFNAMFHSGCICESCLNTSKNDKRTNTLISKYGSLKTITDESERKRRETMQQRYGVMFLMNTEQAQKKRLETIKSRYGVDNVSKLPQVRRKISEKIKEMHAIRKQQK